MSLYGQLCRSCNDMSAAYLLPQVGRPLLIITVCGGIVALTPFQLNSTALLLATAGCVMAVALLQHRSARRALPSMGEASPTTDVRGWMHLALPLLFVDGFASLMIQTDLLLVGAFIDAEAVGHYRIALQTAIGVSFVINAAHAVSAPRFAALSADGDTDGLQHLVRRLVPWVSGLTCVAYGVLVIVAPTLLSLFGPSFDEAYVPLVILATGHLFSGLTGPAGSLLQMTGHHVACAWVYGSVTAVKLVLGAIGLYFFGLVGGAVAAAASMIAWNVALHALVRRRLGITPSVLALVLPDDGVK
jgi:O-antigen/teichoic acid export membrane protein